jgi:integrase
LSSLSQKPRADKPHKPHADFPLFPHATGRWAKKIKGKLHYFGPWSDAAGALQRYLDQKDDLFAGRTPRTTTGGLTVRELVNRFLTAKRHLVDTHELTMRTWQDYYTVCERTLGVLGRDRLVTDLVADDFDRLRTDFAKTHGPVTLANDITRVRVLFKFAFDNSMIPQPVRFGSTFKKPSRLTLRKARQSNGERVFTADDIRRMLEVAGVQLRAMILMGINCGFGNNDCATLPMKSVDLQKGWIHCARPKTGVSRHCPLWSETVAALKEAIADRPVAKDASHEGLVFLTQRGGSWAKTAADNPVCKETVKLLKKLGLHRPRHSFYTLRHVFETVAGDSKDQVAVDHIMGHAPSSNDMSAVYRERIRDERLKAVTDHVHQWLFGNDAKTAKPEETSDVDTSEGSGTATTGT